MNWERIKYEIAKYVIISILATGVMGIFAVLIYYAFKV